MNDSKSESNNSSTKDNSSRPTKSTDPNPQIMDASQEATPESSVAAEHPDTPDNPNKTDSTRPGPTNPSNPLELIPSDRKDLSEEEREKRMNRKMTQSRVRPDFLFHVKNILKNSGGDSAQQKRALTEIKGLLNDFDSDMESSDYSHRVDVNTW